MSKNTLQILIFFLLLFFVKTTIYSQIELFSGIPVSDSGSNNNIGSSNTSRNVDVDNKGNIFVLYANNSEVRLAKSTNGGQSFLASTLIGNAANVEPELNINNTNGTIYIAWMENNDLFFTSSSDEGLNFSLPRIIGQGTEAGVHISSFEENVYVINQNGEKVYANKNNGIGNFTNSSTGQLMVYADVLVDQNGAIYAPMDDPNLLIFESVNQGATLSRKIINPPASVFFSSYVLSDGPCGTFIFVGGGGIFPSDTLGYKIDVKTGISTPIILGKNSISPEGRTLYADNKGTLIDGYKNDDGFLAINVSSNQGDTFNTPIIVAEGDSHNIARSSTTDNILVTYQANGQIYLTVYDDLLKNIELPIPNPPIVLCSDDSFDLPFELSGQFNANTLLSVSLSDASGNFDNATEIGTITTNISGNITCTIPSNLPSSSLYRIQVESLQNCIQSNSIHITVESATISGNSNMCVGNTIQLTGTDNPNTTLPWQSSNPTVATINNLGLLTAISSGTTEITYLTSASCSSTVLIEVFDNPDVIENETITACDDDFDGFTIFDLTTVNTMIVTDIETVTIGYFRSIDNANNNVSAILNTTNYENNNANIETIWVRVENTNGCYSISEVTLEVKFPLQYKINTVESSENNSISIETLNFQPEDIEYSLLNGQDIVYDFQTSPYFDKLETGVFTVLIRYENACKSIEEQVSLLNFPKFFTPNSDNINDFWQIKGIDTDFYQSGIINIFNRYGKQLASFSLDSIGWNGTYNGKVLASNDYWFFAELIDRKNVKRTQSGHFSLLRN